MHGRTITMESWAEIHAELELPSYGTVGTAAITSGEHPHLGAVVAVQMPDGIVIVTELPFADEIDRQLAGQEDEIKAIVSAATSRPGGSHKPSIADMLRARGITPRPFPADDSLVEIEMVVPAPLDRPVSFVKELQRLGLNLQEAHRVLNDLKANRCTRAKIVSYDTPDALDSLRRFGITVAQIHPQA